MSSDVELYKAACMITDPRERERMARRREAVQRIDEAGRGMTCDVMRAEAEALGISPSAMKTAYYTWLRSGRRDESLADGRKQPKACGANLWVEIFKRYEENDKNTSMNAWRVMMNDFRSGTVDGSIGAFADVFRGVGTWQAVWLQENPHKLLPESYPSGWVPEGATYQSLMRLSKRDPDRLFQIAISRQGRKAAHRFLIDVIKTRVGVPVGAIRQWDDVWHNFDVRLPGHEEVSQPLEYAGYDVASAYKCDSTIKPRFTRIDGARDNLKEQTFRFTVGVSHCVTGFHKDGITDIVEGGAAAIRDNIRKQISLIPYYGRLIKFEKSGALSEQVHAGLFVGDGAGNFRFKPMIESIHGKLADRTAHMLGNRGRDAETMHESRAALVRYEEGLMRACEKLAPDVAAMIEFGLMSFDEYNAAYRIVESAFMRDPVHRLEGWDSNTIQEYSTEAVPTDGSWHNVRELLDMSPVDAKAIAAFLQAHPGNVRQRYKSRWEVWRDGQKDLIRVPLMEMPAFLDERDAIELTVRDNGTVDFTNGYFYGRDKMIYRVDALKSPGGFMRRLAPRDKVIVKYNPFAPEQIWIIDRENGSTVGMAQLHSRAPMMDRVEIERSLGVQSADIARKVFPVRGRHQKEAVDRAGRMARNQEAKLGLAKALPSENETVSQDDFYDDVPDAMDVAAGQYATMDQE